MADLAFQPFSPQSVAYQGGVEPNAYKVSAGPDPDVRDPFKTKSYGKDQSRVAKGDPRGPNG